MMMHSVAAALVTRESVMTEAAMSADAMPRECVSAPTMAFVPAEMPLMRKTSTASAFTAPTVVVRGEPVM
jgi:hypothetical protein